jgi:DNA repair exonuclease SbcCD nuclease subunit
MKIKSKLISLGDIHLLGVNPANRKDDLTGTQWKKIHELFAFAKAKEADVLVAGDFSDSSNNYSILNKLAEILRAYKDLGVNVFAVFGQHDLKYRNQKDTNLQILINSGLINLLGSKPVEGEGFRVYGASWQDEIPKPSSGWINLLVIHAPISPSSLFHGHNYISIKDFVNDHPEFSLIICGDVHRTFMEEHNGVLVMNSGPLVRKEASEYNMIHKPGHFFIDMEDVSIKFIEVNHRPGKEVLSMDKSAERRRKELVHARVDTAQFLHELRQRTSEGKLMNIRERIGLRASHESEISETAKRVLECLLNERDLKEWLNKEA